jgi:hypothetical protein
MLTSYTNTARPPGRVNAEPPIEKENRRIQRISLPLPVRVEVRVDTDASWYEITRLQDVSAYGAGFTLKKPVKRGRIVLMTVPMPRQLRSFDYSEPQYKVWAVTRRCIETGKSALNPEYSIGVAFIGQKPPTDYLEHPARLYDVARRDDEKGMYHVSHLDLRADDKELPKEIRKQTRYFIPETLTLQQLDEGGNVIWSESTVTENISLGGAAVFSTLQASAGTFLRVTNDAMDLKILSVVRGSRIGPDGMTRLHLEFIDRFYPLEGLD